MGSNVGDRPGHLKAALEMLPRHGVEVEAVSSAYETEPVGEITAQPEFLNACARIRTSLEPEALLDVCKAIEIQRGRTLGPRHGPRPLDVDILLLGEIEMEGERLALPHRDLGNRRFVLEPLLELEPGLRLPDGTSLAECLQALPDGEQRVRQAGPLL
ncbi:MAG: 2-amino-4-hydroxy-6-hydroxymethyldihydropteridine diphosphokinase [Solirubrobacterales bacterium]